MPKNEKNTTCGSHKIRLAAAARFFHFSQIFPDLRLTQVVSKISYFFRLSAAASRPKTRLATPSLLQVFFLADLRLPKVRFWENKKIQVGSEFGRDHVARGSSAKALSPPRAHRSG